LNLGPSPATHGIFQNILLMDGTNSRSRTKLVTFTVLSKKSLKTFLLPNYRLQIV
jgi:hypothetical protein